MLPPPGKRVHRKAIDSPGHALEQTSGRNLAAAFEGGNSPIPLDAIPWEWLADG
jgi:hypothetical protein